MHATPSQRGIVGAVFGSRPDSEYDMAVNRVVIITTLFVAAIIFGHAEQGISFDFIARLYILYLCAAFAIFAHVSARPEPHVGRRAFSMLLDIGALSFVSARIDPNFVGFLYPAYLLVVYGYGFRFGPNWLKASAAVSVGGVIVVIAVAPAWRANALISSGLLVGLVITPIYAHRLVSSLRLAKAQAEASNRAKSMFVAAVSHDLRTPLNAIIGLGDILAVSQPSREDADMARMIGEAGRALLGQIDSVLDFSRLEMQHAPDSVEPVDLLSMVRGVRELLEVSAQSRGVRLTLQVETPIPRIVVTSPRNIKDSLTNLVGNAIKFTNEGFVHINVRTVGVAADRAHLRFEVSDTGIGISAEAQEQIFERFTQADDSIRDRFGGTGLGLAIARQLILALGGEIGVVSAEGQGSTFWFEVDVGVAIEQPEPGRTNRVATVFSDDVDLIDAVRRECAGVRVETSLEAFANEESPEDARSSPIILDAEFCARQSGEGPACAAVGARMARGRGVIITGESGVCCAGGCEIACTALVRRPFHGVDLANALYLASDAASDVRGDIASASSAVVETSILVVEDNRTNQKVIAKMLERAGHRVEVVDNGKTALDLLANHRFDIVLMDINMPGLDGVETTRRLRLFERACAWRTPVIALTADVTSETRTRCMAAGMDECATKPVELPKLLQIIDRLVVEPLERRNGAPSWSPAAGQAQIIEEGGAPEKKSNGLNHQAFADLERLGGREFVREVCEQFVADAAALLDALADAVRNADVEKFREEAHALRSCAANVGARAMYDLCLSWREMSAQELAAEGAACMVRLESEFKSACVQIEPYIRVAA